MTWIILALLAPMFWATSNIFDKYSLEKNSRGSYDFIFFGTIGNFFILVLTYFAFGVEVFSPVVLFPIAAGFVLNYSYLFYSHALKREDASYVVPLYVTYSIFVLIFSWLLGERITGVQLIAFCTVFVGAVFLALEKMSFDIFKYRKAAMIMIPAILLVSANVLLVDHALEVLPFVDVFFYDVFGFCLSGLSLFLVPSWRREVITGIKTATLRKFKLFFINDTIDLSGHLLYQYALFIAPSVSLVAVLGGIQPFYVLILGSISTVFFPKIVKENISQQEIIQKVIGVGIIAVGLTVLNLYS